MNLMEFHRSTSASRQSRLSSHLNATDVSRGAITSDGRLLTRSGLYRAEQYHYQKQEQKQNQPLLPLTPLLYHPLIRAHLADTNTLSTTLTGSDITTYHRLLILIYTCGLPMCLYEASGNLTQPATLGDELIHPKYPRPAPEYRIEAPAYLGFGDGPAEANINDRITGSIIRGTYVLPGCSRSFFGFKANYVIYCFIFLFSTKEIFDAIIKTEGRKRLLILMGILVKMGEEGGVDRQKTQRSKVWLLRINPDTPGAAATGVPARSQEPAESLNIREKE
ncbi:hypothetical protein KQX54_011042 [Cotesia glomerata]|uniref:Uncharacterized protein n=1 Tax=Cotesia glomerata TaxID=32391 RepID=A0AAV7J449_COTGL|nr:hypothetical protein KQX54_011042 [Cotesia glomerata]